MPHATPEDTAVDENVAPDTASGVKFKASARERPFQLSMNPDSARVLKYRGDSEFLPGTTFAIFPSSIYMSRGTGPPYPTIPFPFSFVEPTI